MRAQCPLPVASNLGQTLSPPDTGGGHGSPQVAGQFATSQRPSWCLQPLPHQPPPQTSRSGVVSRTEPDGGQAAHVPRLCLGPGSCLAPSFQLCSEEKNVHYAQNKHLHRPPGWEGSSEVGASTPTSSVSCVCVCVCHWSHPEFSTRECSDQMEQCSCHKTRVHHPALWRHGHIRGESPQLHGKMAARHLRDKPCESGLAHLFTSRFVPLTLASSAPHVSCAPQRERDLSSPPLDDTGKAEGSECASGVTLSLWL